MLTRINGVAFNQEELDAWEKKGRRPSAITKRSARKMGLFMTDDLVGRGLPVFCPQATLSGGSWRGLISRRRSVHAAACVMTPASAPANLCETSIAGITTVRTCSSAGMEGELCSAVNCPTAMI